MRLPERCQFCPQRVDWSRSFPHVVPLLGTGWRRGARVCRWLGWEATGRRLGWEATGSIGGVLIAAERALAIAINHAWSCAVHQVALAVVQTYSLLPFRLFWPVGRAAGALRRDLLVFFQNQPWRSGLHNSVHNLVPLDRRWLGLFGVLGPCCRLCLCCRWYASICSSCVTALRGPLAARCASFAEIAVTLGSCICVGVAKTWDGGCMATGWWPCTRDTSVASPAMSGVRTCCVACPACTTCCMFSGNSVAAVVPPRWGASVNR